MREVHYDVPRVGRGYSQLRDPRRPSRARTAMAASPGDILLVNDYSGDADVLGNLIRAGERVRYGDSDWARWTHSALVVEGGMLVEALAGGVALSPISKYDDVETLLIAPPLAPGDPRRAFAVRFARAHVGDGYDDLDFAGLAIALLTGVNWALHDDKRFICSGLVARATESYTDSGYQQPPEAMLPADLGSYWDALSGRPLPPLSLFGRFLNGFKAFFRALV